MYIRGWIKKSLSFSISQRLNCKVAILPSTTSLQLNSLCLTAGIFAGKKTLTKYNLGYTVRKLKLHVILETKDISHFAVVQILYVRKLFAKWVACLLTIHHRHKRATTFREVFVVFQPQSGRFSPQFHNCKRNMKPPESTGGQTSIKIVDFSIRIGNEEGRCVSVRQLSPGDSFLGYTDDNPHR